MAGTLLDAITNRINDHVLSLRALCKTAEDARDRSDETTYRETVDKIAEERAELQQWYARRRALDSDDVPTVTKPDA